MSSVNVTGIQVLNNPSKFTDNFQFEITFECIKELDADLEWKLTYVGSAESEECDQELDSVLVGPVPMGVNRFVFETPPPDHTKIPKQDLIGVTVCLISCLYKNKEFIRIGYYVNNEYDDPELAALSGATDQDGMDIDESDGDEEEEEEEEEEEDGDGNDDEGKKSDVKDKPSSSSSLSSSTTDAAAPANAAAAIADEKPTPSAGTKRKPEQSSEEAENMANNKKSEEESKKKLKTGNGEPAQKAVFQLPPDFSIDKIKRSILEEKPRLTRFTIDWEA